MIIFENINTGETVGIDRETGGKYYKAKLTAVMNSSNLSPNADRGQDFGYRLIPEQQALIEEWEQDALMIDRVSAYTRVMLDDLTHSEFLSYLLHEQEAGQSPERTDANLRRQNELDYEARVAALRAQKVPEPLPQFDPAVLEAEEKVALEAAAAKKAVTAKK